jgi:hypothetical protein
MRGGLPKGCELCLEGAKLVLFVTGLCDKACFYCPLSEMRKGRDTVYADEVTVKDDLSIILEGRAIDAKGTGITGGDPLLRPERTLRYIRVLKDFFGESHHIHLYTSGRHADRRILLRLRDAGLDEIRFHPERRDWGKMALAKEAGLCTGAEMPAIPGGDGMIRELVKYMAEVGADFLNLNELEFCATNAIQLRERGFALGKESMAAVAGSGGTAIVLISWAKGEGIDMPIHYCSSSTKDAVQTRLRFLRRSRNVARPYEEGTEEGLLAKFIIKDGVKVNGEWRRRMAKEVGVPPQMVGISGDFSALEASEGTAAMIRKRHPAFQVAYVQEYPTATRQRFSEYPC